MNRVFLVGIFVCLFATTTVRATPITFGIKAGINSVSMTTGSLDSRLGIQFGGVADYKITDFFSIQGELLYSQKDADIKSSYNDEACVLLRNYFEVPILAKLKIDRNFSIYGGGYLAYLPGKQLSIPLFDAHTRIVVEVDNFYEEFDYGIIVGGQAMLSENLAIDARYTLALSNALKKDNSVMTEIISADAMEGKNATISLSAVYMF